MTPIVNFKPDDVLNIANAIIKVGRVFEHKKQLKNECFEKGWNYRRFVEPLLTFNKSWTKREAVKFNGMDRFIGMCIKDARAFELFLRKLIRELKEVMSDNAEQLRKLLIEHSEGIAKTIKLCEKGIY